MSVIDWSRIDKFYLVLGVILVLASVLLIVTFRTVFSAYLTAYEVDQQAVDGQLSVEKEKLDEAYEMVFDKEIPTLDVR